MLHQKEKSTTNSTGDTNRATHPLQFVTTDYLIVKKAVGFENILVITNHFTKFAQANSANNQKASTTAKLVLDIM